MESEELNTAKMITKLAETLEELAHTNVDMSQVIMEIVKRIENLEEKAKHRPKDRSSFSGKLTVVKDDD